MKLAETVINSSTNLRMVHSDTHDKHYDKGTWSIADIDVDEVYTGTFNLNTNMSLSWPVVSIVSEDSWLPCCFEGWKNMSSTSKGGGATGVQPPWGTVLPSIRCATLPDSENPPGT